ncbi:transposase, mutator type [Mycobacterium lentiflavum]|uniref:Transposase, mutator type n=1 Tax=Mycobacterium lentiflavum TaxID=141349 RepID=A0A0E4GYK2_MYCLN|nr:transposase, mutator type [Mycobacterium lentiflavum]
MSASTITRLTAQWQDEAAAFGRRDLSGTDYVYQWVDGIHLKVRLEQTKLCLLVMIGVRGKGRSGHWGVDRSRGQLWLRVSRVPGGVEPRGHCSMMILPMVRWLSSNVWAVFMLLTVRPAS